MASLKSFEVFFWCVLSSISSYCIFLSILENFFQEDLLLIKFARLGIWLCNIEVEMLRGVVFAQIGGSLDIDNCLGNVRY